MTEQAFFCTLLHEGILAVQGSDVEQFLQGQLTCNLKTLTAERSSLGARCTAKGRMQSSFRILSDEGQYLLAMSRELVEPQLADLKKYAMFSKSSLRDASAEWVRFGLSGADNLLSSLGLTLSPEANQVARHAEQLAVRLPDGRAELWVKAATADSLRAQLAASLTEAPLNTWLLQQIRAGIGQVTEATRELFIPQMINLQCLGGVSFKKGCYTGQEIVARTQHLGKLKRQLYRLSAAATESLPPAGTELFSPVHSSSVGEVVLSAQAEQGIELLAVLQEDAVADGRIHLASTEGLPLSLLDLPYAPSEQDSQR